MEIALVIGLVRGLIELYPKVIELIDGMPEGQEKQTLLRDLEQMVTDVQAASANWRNSAGPNG